jgi:glycosyltransferase involved in cell wall biosynthesis
VAEPAVSVIVPVRDGTRYLRQTLESVLAQRDMSFELIVVDDGSEDGSAELAREVAPEATVVSQPAQGETVARNRGIELAVGPYLSFIDADDLWPPQKLALQMQVLEASPEVDLVFGNQRAFRSEELSEEHRFRGEGKVQASLTWGTMLARREAFEKAGRFEADGTTIGGFLDWLARARDAGCTEVTLEDVVLLRRLHPWSLTASRPELTADYARVLKGVIDRRRGQ